MIFQKLVFYEITVLFSEVTVHAERKVKYSLKEGQNSKR